MEIACPQCKSKKIVEGRVYNQPDYIAPRAYFRPNGLKFFAILGVNVRMENRFFSCLECGFVWAKIDPQQLRRVLTESGTLQLKKRLQLTE